MKKFASFSTIMSILLASIFSLAQTATFSRTTMPTALPGQIAVDLVDDADWEDVSADLAVSMYPTNEWSEDNDLLMKGYVRPKNMEAVLARLRTDPRVEYAEPMYVVQASWVPNDPLYKKLQWHMQRIGTESAWTYSCGRGVTVAVIDTGVACFDDGPFSKGTDLNGTECVEGYNFVSKNKKPADDHGHGTHVAGTIAQTTNNGRGVTGIAFCARLMPLKVLTANGWGTVPAIANAIRFAADNGAQVINMSLGGGSRSSIMESAIKYARKKGVIVVAAAGNNSSSVEYPAAYKGVIAVSATDPDDGLAQFSSRGPEIAVGAPGVDVTQQTICDGGENKCEQFGTFNGTSMASPHVAGVAALMVSLGVTHPNAVEKAIRNSADEQQNKIEFGSGILNAGAAARRVLLKRSLLRSALLLGVWIAVWYWVKRKGNNVLTKSPLAIFGSLLTSVGLLWFAPFIGVGSHMGVWADMLMRPIGEWDILLSANIHRYLPLVNALPAVILTGLLFRFERVRPLIGGVALGTVALLLQLLWSADVITVFGATLGRVWMVANVVLCLWISRISLEQQVIQK